jgi:hypothetical protein
MFRMGSHDPFGHLKHKLWPKERSESNWQFDFPSLKVMNQPNFLMCKWHATHRWKTLDEGYNFSSNLISIGGLHTKLCAFKVVRDLTLGISGLPFWSPETKSHLDVGLVERHKIYYVREGGGFPQVWAVMNLVSLRSPVVRPNTKNTSTMH